MRKRSGLKLVVALLLSGLLMVWGAGAALADTGTASASGSAGSSGSGATTGAQQQLTLQQALKMAMASNTTLNSASSAVNQANNNLVTTQTQNAATLTYTPSGTSTVPTSVSSGVETALNSLTTANLNVAYQQRLLQTGQDSVVYSVYQDYLAIVQDEAALDAAQQAFNLADLQQRVTNLEYQVGSASQDDVSQENQSYAASQSSLSSTQESLDTAYQQFNQLVGLVPDDRPVLTDQPSYALLVIGSLDAEVSRVLADSPSILQAQNTVISDKTALTMVSYVPSANAATSDTLNEAENSLAGAENNASQSERALYQTIITLESKQDSLQQALTTAETNLKMTQVEYEVGMDTKVELETAQSSLTQAQLALLENTVSHQIDVMAFETPWAAGGSGGSSSGSTSSGR
jgi:outer membrane protein